jgi:RNA-directed DNA polymerase
MVPTPAGGERPLGIPTLRDRGVQTAVLVILPPLFEVDMDPTTAGDRPGRSARDAGEPAPRARCAGQTQGVDADVSQDFDTLPQAAVMQALARRISDRKLLWLLKRWLKRPVAERTGRGRWRDPGGKRATRGIAQGGVISPLLATLDMKRSRRACRQAGLARRDGARLVNEADDVVVRCRQGAAAVLAQTRQWVQQRGVTWNEQETRRCNGRQEPVTFLGYTGGPRVYRKDGHW